MLTNLQKEMIVGCLLGDGRLESRSKNKTVRLRIHHSDSQKSYLFWKYKILQNITSNSPKRSIYLDKRNNQEYYSWYFHTLTIEELRYFYEIFYKDGKKIIPKNIFDILTSLSLAVWLMDDGCNFKNSLVLNTQSFSLKEQKVLINVLEKKYQLEATINKDRKNYRLRINKENSKRFKEIVKSYIIPFMKHKIVTRND